MSIDDRQGQPHMHGSADVETACSAARVDDVVRGRNCPSAVILEDVHVRVYHVKEECVHQVQHKGHEMVFLIFYFFLSCSDRRLLILDYQLIKKKLNRGGGGGADIVITGELH
jgi:hypothetical protein